MNVLESFALKGKTAVVVGGTGLYGRQITAALAEAGATVYITTRQQERLAEIEREYKAEGIEIKAVYMDQSLESTIISAKDHILNTRGTIDVLVNNAVGRMMNGWDDTADNFTKSMEVNGTGIYLTTKIFGNVMKNQGSGSIIQIASMYGMVGPDDWLYEGEWKSSPDYFFYKAGMINFTKYVASYYGKSNVRCNCISPGGIESYRTPPAFVERYRTRTMLNRMAGETDLKGIIVFLASDASVYITAANIPVDGGYTAK